MKKLSLLAILLLSISSSIFACGGVSDLNPSEVSIDGDASATQIETEVEVEVESA